MPKTNYMLRGRVYFECIYCLGTVFESSQISNMYGERRVESLNLTAQVNSFSWTHVWNCYASDPFKFSHLEKIIHVAFN